jgi:hypothetical protein
MAKLKIQACLFIIVILCFSVQIIPCTTVIISGKATKDGRPLLLKNRDSDFLQNRLMYFNDGKYPYIGLVNSEDKAGKSVWGGFNKAGFAIMNSASYNLKRNDTTKIADREGEVMKLALQKCSTIQEFEQLLRDLPKPLGVEANFGVIDAFGGAAYYETDNFNFKKYDVNDPAVAPNGYIVRTNFSCSGEEDKGSGYIRFNTAESLMKDACKKGELDYDFLLNSLTRSLKHSLTNTDLTKNLPKNYDDSKFVWFQDYIPRTSTSSAVLIQGIKKGENTQSTTFWSIVGFPLTSVIVPVWLTDSGALPSVLTADENGLAPLCSYALKLKAKLFPPAKGYGEKYMDISKLMNKSKTGLRQKLIPVEKEIVKKGESALKLIRQNKAGDAEITAYYKWVDEYVLSSYKKLIQ